MAIIAVPLASHFEDSEFSFPVEKLKAAGHTICILGDEAGKKLAGLKGKTTAKVDDVAAKHSAGDFDAMLIPGGYSPDQLRLNKDVVNLVRDFFEADKTVAAICHAGQLLIEAEVVQGRKLTSWPSVRKDLENAGANWVDQEVVEDKNLITSRNPDDLPAFTDALLKRLD